MPGVRPRPSLSVRSVPVAVRCLPAGIAGGTPPAFVGRVEEGRVGMPLTGQGCRRCRDPLCVELCKWFFERHAGIMEQQNKAWDKMERPTRCPTRHDEWPRTGLAGWRTRIGPTLWGRPDAPIISLGPQPLFR